MPIYPGDEPPNFKKVATLEKEHYRETEITFYSHTGTHIDAPGHILENGPFLDNLKVSHFFGKATIISFPEISNKINNIITINKLKRYQEKINKVQFLIFNLGWGKYWGKENYFENYPYLSDEAAEWLSGFNLQGVGIDAISIDKSDTSNFPIHKTLLSKNIIIIENLTNLDFVKNDFFMFSVLPLKYKNADGSPVRAIAIENI
jgi:arylformamidase